ncbi:MAG: imidazole glycerol phosphate synthase subunit HisH [Planctomycetota bacterium]|jgi:imidazole glycerol phosphate synthase glutamine amidotransferase subunit
MLDLVNVGGNIGSITRCLRRLGVGFRQVRNGNELDGRSPIVLPGVGSFGAVMKNLETAGMVEKLRSSIGSGIPLLGICVGMQVLFEKSEESPGTAGLGVIEGEVVRFRKGKVPQIGWNRIEPKVDSGYESGYVYFVNSYYPEPENEEAVLYGSDYNGPFCAGVKTKNITAYQFHPEKSGKFGHGLIRRWLDAL